MSTPNTNDFVVGLDPTGFTNITGAQLAQLVNSATPSSDRGMILVSIDAAGVPNVPNAVGTIEWQRYMWLRVSATYVTAYVWNPNGATDATYLNWVTLSQASLAPGSIQGYQIANNTIPASAIISLTSTQITGSVVAGWLAQLNLAGTAYAVNGLVNNNSPMFGVMSGAGSTVAVPVFGANVIPATAFMSQTIAGNAAALLSPIVDNTITTRQLVNSGAPASTARTVAAVDPANNIIVPTLSQIGTPVAVPVTQAVAVGDVVVVAYGKNGYTTANKAILNLAEPAAPAAQQALIVAAGASVYSAANTNGVNFGRLLQLVSASTTTRQISTGLLSMTDSTAGLTTAQTSGLAANITPVMGTAGSKIRIHATVPVYTNSANALWLGLYDSVSTSFLAYARFNGNYGSGFTGSLALQAVTAALSVNTLRTYTVYMGFTGGTAVNGAVNQFSEGAWITLEEII